MSTAPQQNLPTLDDTLLVDTSLVGVGYPNDQPTEPENGNDFLHEAVVAPHVVPMSALPDTACCDTFQPDSTPLTFRGDAKLEEH